MLESPQRWTVRKVSACEFKGSSRIVAAAGIKLGAMIGEREQMLTQKFFEAKSSDLHSSLRIRKSIRRDQYVCEAPTHFRIAT